MRNINLQAVSNYIATAHPAQVGALRDVCRNRASALKLKKGNGKHLPAPTPGITHQSFNLHGFIAWADEVQDDESKATLADVLAALESKVG